MEVVRLSLASARPSDYLQKKVLDQFIAEYTAEHGFPPAAGGASFSDYLENKILDHIFNDGSYTAPSPSLGLWTSALTDASTGATSGEASYTGYARKAIAAADMSAAASGSKTNSSAITFDPCTSGTSTITYWGTFDSGTTGAGNLLVWGTATSTVISTTQTPATIAIGGLVVTLD
jgi:hypothetical protein